jgi:hypothetical protein
MGLNCQGSITVYPNLETTYAITGMVGNAPGDVDRIYLDSVYWLDITNTPHAAIAQFFGGNGNPAYLDTTNGRYFYTVQSAPLWLKVKGPVNLGPATLAVTLEASSPTTRQSGKPGPTETTGAAVTVTAVPAPPLTVPVPNYALWRSTGVQLGQQWAPQIIQGTLGLDGWYYSLPAVYWQLGDWNQANMFAQAAIACADQYVAFLQGCNGQPPGYEVFPDCLRMTWERTQNPKYRDALLLLKNAPYVIEGGDPSCELIRETAYAAMTYLEFLKIGQPPDARLQQTIEFLLGHFDQLFNQRIGSLDEPFFDGLAAEAMTRYYCEVQPDGRIVDAVRMMTEFIWKYGTNPATGQIEYDLYKPGGDMFSSLNLLLVNAWGFLYALTGDTVARDRGDILFSHFADEGLTWSAKVFGQNYWLSPKYLRYRGVKF